MFIDDKLWENLEADRMKEIMCAVSLDTFEMIMRRSEKYAGMYECKKRLLQQKVS